MIEKDEFELDSPLEEKCPYKGFVSNKIPEDIGRSYRKYYL